MGSKKRDEEVVLITGATGGIGTVTANLLHNNGYKVYGTTRNLNSAPKTSFKLLQLDVTEDTSVKGCIEEIISKEGKIDVLINNASFSLCGSVTYLSAKDFQAQFETNFFGVHRMISEVLPGMLEREEGKIINIGTLGGRAAMPFQAPYSSTKAALAIYTDTIRMELQTKGIKVSLVEPGDIKTDFQAGRKFAKGYENDLVAQQVVDLYHENERKGTPPKRVAKKIHKIIRKNNPKPRYLVGLMQTFLVGFLFRLLPISVQVWGLMWYFKIPRN
ncbi:MAG: SDR family oxidoreductase [Asgard group archaeon]|nr:SDR family oxidoreductase [Asgard group archaeon]